MIFISRTLSGTYFVGVYIPIAIFMFFVYGILQEFTRLTYYYYNVEKESQSQRFNETYNEIVLTYPIATRLPKEKWLMIFDFWELFGRPFNPFIFTYTSTKELIKKIEI